MVVFHFLRSMRYLFYGRYLSGPAIGVFDEATTHVYAGYRMMDAFMHVNNARYLEIFEFARWHEAGAKRSIPIFKKAGMYPVVAAVHIQFLKEVPPASMMMVRSKVVGFEERAMVVRQHMFNRTGTKLHATALFRVSLVDTRSKKPATVPIEEALNRLEVDSTAVRAAAEACWLKDFIAPAEQPHASNGVEAAHTNPAPAVDNVALRVLRDVSVLDNDWRRVMKRLQDRIGQRKK